MLDYNDIKIIFNNKKSDKILMYCRLLQGSIVSPMLLNIYNDDIFIKLNRKVPVKKWLIFYENRSMSNIYIFVDDI